MKYVLEGIEPVKPLHYFEELSAIPRGSRNEKAAAEYVVSKANEFGLYVRKDEHNNVFVKKPATAGMENLMPVMLQAHLDMVCEKTPESDHDFMKDGIRLVKDGDILKADGTTLGADDGYGCGYMLALMDTDSDAFPHPELQFLFTTGEEIGFTGAMALDPYDITARRMISLDCGREGRIDTTSAGGEEIRMYADPEYEKISGNGLCITVSGLKGGHSAVSITEERANANKIMGRLLHNIAKICEIRLCSITGGRMFNAIPRDCSAVIAVPAGKEEAVKACAASILAQLKDEYAATDEGLCIEISAASPEKQMSGKATRTVIEAMYCIPNGIRMMNKLVPGLPVTSVNMGAVREENGKIMIGVMTRSSIKSLNDDLADNIVSVAGLCGITDVDMGYWIPAWPHNPKSAMREIYRNYYKRVTGNECVEVGTHGGLELGVFCEMMPGMDILTLGPNSWDCHTVTERLSLSSYAKTYTYLKDFLKELTRS